MLNSNEDNTCKFKMLKASSIWLRKNRHLSSIQQLSAAGLSCRTFIFTLLMVLKVFWVLKWKCEIIPPDASFSTCSLTIGEVRWMLSFSMGSFVLVTIIAASWIDGVMTYFSSVTSFRRKWEDKVHVNLLSLILAYNNPLCMESHTWTVLYIHYSKVCRW